MAQSVKSSPFYADPEDELPVSVQLNWRLRSLITSGRLAIGERLPSVRQLAEWSGVNVNTARAVYEALEDDGLVISRHGLGTFVSAGAAADEAVERIAARAIADATEAGVDPRDVVAATWACADLSEPGAGRDAEAVGVGNLDLEALTEADELPVRGELRRQIGRLEAELAHFWQDLPADERGLAAPRSDPHLSNAAELELVRDELMKQLRKARALTARRAAREFRSRERLEAMTAEPAVHRWESVSDVEMGEPGCRTYRVAPRLGPLGALMSWWQVKVSGGCPLAAAA